MLLLGPTMGLMLLHPLNEYFGKENTLFMPPLIHTKRMR